MLVRIEFGVWYNYLWKAQIIKLLWLIQSEIVIFFLTSQREKDLE